MRQFVLGLIAAVSLLILVGFTQQEKDYSLSRTQKISGKLVFMNAEPLQEYEVLFYVKPFYMGSPETPHELAEPVVKKALNEKQDFDAIIMNVGKKHIAIKFKKN